MDTRAEHAFVGVDVADADDIFRVHQEQLNGHSMPARRGVQRFGVERRRQRLDAQAGDQLVGMRVGRCPQHCAEPARIAQPKDFCAHDKVEMVMLLRLGATLNDP